MPIIIPPGASFLTSVLPEPRQILVLPCDLTGSGWISRGFFRALRQRWTKATLHLLLPAPLMDLGLQAPGVNKVHGYPADPTDLGRLLEGVQNHLRDLEVDWVISPHPMGFVRQDRMVLSTLAPVRLGATGGILSPDSPDIEAVACFYTHLLDTRALGLPEVPKAVGQALGLTWKDHERAPLISVPPGRLQEPTHIAVVRGDSIGDAVLGAGLFGLLKQKYSLARITVVCREAAAPIFQNCPHVTHVIAFDRNRLLEDREYRNAMILALNQMAVDIAICPVWSRDPAVDLLMAALPGHQKIGMTGDTSNQAPELKERSDKIYSRLIPSEESYGLELDRLKDLVKGLGLREAEVRPEVWTTREEEEAARTFFMERGIKAARTIAFFPGAQHAVRIYPHFRPVLEALAQEGFHILGLGSPQESSLVGELLDGLPGQHENRCGTWTLGQCSAVMRRCRLGLGAESGLAHMACAVGTPHVIVVGGGHFGRFMPYSPLTSMAVLPLDCYLCNWSCRFERAHCVKDLSHEVVLHAVRAALEAESPLPRVFAQASMDPLARGPSYLSMGDVLDLDRVHLEEILPPAVPGPLPLITAEPKVDPLLTVFCAVWHLDPERFERLHHHQACLDRQSIDVSRIYVFDGGDSPPGWLKGTVIVSREPLTIYEAWSMAVHMASTAYVMNLNLDDRLCSDAAERLVVALEGGADLVGGDWRICFDPETTNATGISVPVDALPLTQSWPPIPGEDVRLGSGTGERWTYGPATAWRRNLHAELGRFPARFSDGSPVRLIGDTLWWDRIYRAGGVIKRLPWILGHYHSHPEDQAEFRNSADAERDRAKRMEVLRS